MIKSIILIPDFEQLRAIRFERPVAYKGTNNPVYEYSGPEFISGDLYATFWQDPQEYYKDPHSYEFVSPDHPLPINGYEVLYDDILDRMSYAKLLASDSYKDSGYTEEEYAPIREKWKQQLSPSEKEAFLKEFILKQMKFEEIRPKVFEMVVRFMSENPQFKYACIASYPKK